MILVISTVKDIDEGKRIIDTLLNEHLIACGNIIPNITSIFFWKNNKEEINEAMIFLKTKEEKFHILIKKIKEIHSYEIPEIIAIPITYGNPEYLKWIEESLI
jgi:periplasmic divalent cation tolerance protein